MVASKGPHAILELYKVTTPTPRSPALSAQSQILQYDRVTSVGSDHGSCPPLSCPISNLEYLCATSPWMVVPPEKRTSPSVREWGA